MTTTAPAASKLNSHHTMTLVLVPVAAIGYSILYMLFGGGLLGAIVIFIIAKMFLR